MKKLYEKLEHSSQEEYEKYIWQKILDVANYINKYAIRKNPNIWYVKVDEQTWIDMGYNAFRLKDTI